jgi:hypothetical protein
MGKGRKADWRPGQKKVLAGCGWLAKNSIGKEMIMIRDN